MLFLAKLALCYLLLNAWVLSYRKKGELDLPQDEASRHVRWLSTVLLLGVALRLKPPVPLDYHPVGMTGVLDAFERMPWTESFAAASAAMFVWPNFSVHIVRFLRWLKLLSPAEPGYAEELRVRLGKASSQTPQP